MICMRKGCNRDATKYVNQRTTYCTFHKKIMDSRGVARKAGKFVPDFAVLSEMFLANRVCPSCSIVMDPYKEYPKGSKCGDMPSLQHNKDGTISILCRNCNTREGHHTLGYGFKDVVGKFCPGCKQDLPRESFYACKARKHLDGLNTYCKCCAKLNMKGKNYYVGSVRWSKHHNPRL